MACNCGNSSCGGCGQVNVPQGLQGAVGPQGLIGPIGPIGPDGPNGKSLIEFSLFANNQSSKEIPLGAMTDLASFIFDGLTYFSPDTVTNIKFLANADPASDGTTGQLRIFDETNGLIIATINIAGPGEVIYTIPFTSFLNSPSAAQAIWTIQGVSIPVVSTNSRVFSITVEIE